jgi:hypothetical protein
MLLERAISVTGKRNASQTEQIAFQDCYLVALSLARARPSCLLLSRLVSSSLSFLVVSSLVVPLVVCLQRNECAFSSASYGSYYTDGI